MTRGRSRSTDASTAKPSPATSARAPTSDSTTVCMMTWLSGSSSPIRTSPRSEVTDTYRHCHWCRGTVPAIVASPPHPSKGRPRHVAVGIELRVARHAQQAIPALEERFNLMLGEQWPQCVTQLLHSGLIGAEIGKLVDEHAWDLFATEVPDHRAQLGHMMERQAVIDTPHASAHVEQAVPTFAVGVVGQQIEQRHSLQLAAMRLS